jgi:hypothetical protein
MTQQQQLQHGHLTPAGLTIYNRRLAAFQMAWTLHLLLLLLPLVISAALALQMQQQAV